MKVSVLMPVYNGGERMRRTLESVLAQSERDFELICVDDGSTDGVSSGILDECAARDDRVRVFHKNNEGPFPANNFALQVAKGDFVVRCDQDDVMHPQELEFCCRAAEKLELDFLSFRYERFHGALPVADDVLDLLDKVIVLDGKRLVADSQAYCKALQRVHSDTWSLFIRRTLALSMPMTPESEFTRPFALIRASRRWAVSSAKLYFYDAGVDTSMSHQPPKLEILKAKHEDLRRLFDLYSDVRQKGDPHGEWRAICKEFIVNRFKHEYNGVRRVRQFLSAMDRLKLETELVFAIREFFIKRKIPFEYVRFRQRMAYRWLLFRYRKVK